MAFLRVPAVLGGYCASISADRPATRNREILPALVAIAPHVGARPAEILWLAIALSLAGIAVVGMGAGELAPLPCLRLALLSTLSGE
ncbi:MAG: hypothetical protein AB1486_26700 [Planctomycetota bacterium]